MEFQLSFSHFSLKSLTFKISSDFEPFYFSKEIEDAVITAEKTKISRL